MLYAPQRPPEWLVESNGSYNQWDHASQSSLSLLNIQGQGTCDTGQMATRQYETVLVHLTQVQDLVLVKLDDGGRPGVVSGPSTMLFSATRCYSPRHDRGLTHRCKRCQWQHQSCHYRSRMTACPQESCITWEIVTFGHVQAFEGHFYLSVAM